MLAVPMNIWTSKTWADWGNHLQFNFTLDNKCSEEDMGSQMTLQIKPDKGLVTWETVHSKWLESSISQ